MSSTESAASTPAVELNGLGVTYGGPTGRGVLRGIDLSVAPEKSSPSSDIPVSAKAP